jgi:hypothetical protein
MAAQVAPIAETALVAPLHLTGTCSWKCRYCGKWNQLRVDGSQWRVRCCRATCQRWQRMRAFLDDVPRGGERDAIVCDDLTLSY